MVATTDRLPAPDAGLWMRIGWFVLLAGALLAFGNAVFFATVKEFATDYGGGSEVPELSQKARMFLIPAVGYAHTLGGAVAALIGPFQFLSFIRIRHRLVHRWLGRIYLVSVGLSAIAGLYLSASSEVWNAFGMAFIALALAWLYTGTNAYLTIRRGDVAAHRRWMIRNYALTYAAVTLRLEIPALIVLFGVAPQTSAEIVAWMCWIPNLIVVEAWFRYRTA